VSVAFAMWLLAATVADPVVPAGVFVDDDNFVVEGRCTRFEVDGRQPEMACAFMSRRIRADGGWSLMLTQADGSGASLELGAAPGELPPPGARPRPRRFVLERLHLPREGGRAAIAAGENPYESIALRGECREAFGATRESALGFHGVDYRIECEGRDAQSRPFALVHEGVLVRDLRPSAMNKHDARKRSADDALEMAEDARAAAEDH
jgi:hypothetical protein